MLFAFVVQLLFYGALFPASLKLKSHFDCYPEDYLIPYIALSIATVIIAGFHFVVAGFFYQRSGRTRLIASSLCFILIIAAILTSKNAIRSESLWLDLLIIAHVLWNAISSIIIKHENTFSFSRVLSLMLLFALTLGSIYVYFIKNNCDEENVLNFMKYTETSRVEINNVSFMRDQIDIHGDFGAQSKAYISDPINYAKRLSESRRYEIVDSNFDKPFEKNSRPIIFKAKNEQHRIIFVDTTNNTIYLDRNSW